MSVAIVGIGLLDNRQACESFVMRYRFSFPNAYDADGRVARSFGFTTQPYWAVISRAGLLLRAGYGPADEAELVQTIASLAKR